jgi:hypothetical protein
MVATSVESRAQAHIQEAEEENKDNPYSTKVDQIKQEEKENGTKAHAVMEERAKEIIAHLKFPEKTRVLLLDDYLSTGGSFQEIAAAFHKNRGAKDWEFEGFALMSGFEDSESPYNQHQLDNVPYKWGIRDPHASSTGPYSSYGWEYRNLKRSWDSANSSDHMVHPRRRSMIIRPDFIGVNTDPLSTSRAERDEESPVKWRNWIRNSLRRIGNQVVHEVQTAIK